MADSNKGSESENLSRIKDILFGDDLQSIEHKLTSFKSENQITHDKLKKDLDERFKSIETELNEKAKRIAELQGKNNEDQKDIISNFKQEIININIDAKNEREKFVDSITEKISELTEQISGFEDSLKQAIEEIKQELKSKSEDLDNSKVNKSSVVELFSEMAEKLKNS